MDDTEHTHEVAEKTDRDGTKTRIETVRISGSERSEEDRVSSESEPKQVQPDGR